jgi:hypothetical protein
VCDSMYIYICMHICVWLPYEWGAEFWLPGVNRLDIWTFGYSAEIAVGGRKSWCTAASKWRIHGRGRMTQVRVHQRWRLVQTGDNDVMGRLTVCILPGPAVQEKLVYHGPGVGTSVQIVVCPFVLVQRLHWTVEINADNGRPGHCTIIS